MKYKNIIMGVFIDRPNRFIANVLINGVAEKVHVKNTGRCKELLEKGNIVYLEDFKDRMGTRKMRYSLIGVLKNSHINDSMVNKDSNVKYLNSKDVYYANYTNFVPSYKGIIINMDSQAPNKVVHEALLDGSILLPGMGKLGIIKPEQKYKNSRFDFYVEDEYKQRAYIEVKGCTLEYNGTAYFPDAPTKRGSKHVHELIDSINEGFKAFVILVVQIEDLKLFRPNWDTDYTFSKSLLEANKKGVCVLAYNCNVTCDSLSINKPMSIELRK